jgi:hypothetical protein
VPKPLHNSYPKNIRGRLIDLAQFIQEAGALEA